jgi:hypothetical protein
MRDAVLKEDNGSGNLVAYPETCGVKSSFTVTSPSLSYPFYVLVCGVEPIRTCYAVKMKRLHLLVRICCSTSPNRLSASEKSPTSLPETWQESPRYWCYSE